MRFSIRDCFWLIVVVAVTLAWSAAAYRSVLLEARLNANERLFEELKTENRATTNENKNLRLQAESFFEAFRKLELPDEQRKSFGTFFTEELEQHGIPLEIQS